MRIGRFAALIAALATAAGAQELLRAPQEPVVARAAVATDIATDIAYAELGTRLTVPVAVGRSGPFPFVIDTGAERTVVSRELANRLGLSPGQPVNLTSMVDRSLVQTVIVPELAIESIGQRHTVHAPALAGRDLGAIGMLGIDLLQNHKVLIDFDKGVMTVDQSSARPMKRRKRDEIVISGRSKYGQLIVTNARLNGQRIQVVLDTGAQVSIGNSALLQLINQRARKALKPTEITSVTGAKAPASYTMVPGIWIDGVMFNNLAVAFADVEPFRHFELEDRPALLLGMDALRSFRRVEIDFPNRQVRFRIPPPDPLSLRRNTSSMIPGVEGTSPSRSY
jgi:predicted aspartyl protease